MSPDIKHMVNLRILAVRDNELIEVPQVTNIHCTKMISLLGWVGNGFGLSQKVMKGILVSSV